MLANGQGAETTGTRAVLEELSGLQDQKLAKRFNVGPAPRAVALYLSLYPNRVQGILRPPGCKTWTTISKHWPVPDETVSGAISGQEKNLYGLRWGSQTHFAVFDIDQGSPYHRADELTKLQERLSAVGLRVTLYRSSERGGWHAYLFLDDWTDSNELRETLKKWLHAHGYEIRNGVLEIFPSGMGLRLPLQPGFAWLDDNAELIAERKELSTEAALSRFLSNLKDNASDWSYSKSLIETELQVIAARLGAKDQAHEDAIDTAGFEDFFNYRLIPEKYEEGRQYWQSGLTAKGQRHDAILAVEHYLWHGDRFAGVPALPADWNNEQRYRLILAWLKRNHNGFCNHINRGNWRKVEAQVRRSVAWRRPSGAVQVRTAYPMTENAIEVLTARSKSTGRTWTPDDLKKGNDGRENNARKRIGRALQLLIDQGRRISRNELARLAGCSPNTVSRHRDLWFLLACGSGDWNPFLDHLGAGGAVPDTGTKKEKKEISDRSGDSRELAPIVLTPPSLLPGAKPTGESPASRPSPAGAFGSLDAGSSIRRCSGRGAGATGGLGPSTQESNDKGAVVCYAVGTASGIKELTGATSSKGALPYFGLEYKFKKIVPDTTDFKLLTTVLSGFPSGIPHKIPILFGVQETGGSLGGSLGSCREGGGRRPAPVVDAASGRLFVISQMYRLAAEQTNVADVRVMSLRGKPFEVFLHQPTAIAPESTSTCIHCGLRVSRLPTKCQASILEACPVCRRLLYKVLGVSPGGKGRGPPKCMHCMASHSYAICIIYRVGNAEGRLS